jgi:hypothetical protein
MNGLLSACRQGVRHESVPIVTPPRIEAILAVISATRDLRAGTPSRKHTTSSASSLSLSSNAD